MSIFKYQRKQNKQFCVSSKFLMHTSGSYHDLADNDPSYDLIVFYNDFPTRQLPRDISGLPDTDQVKFSPDYLANTWIAQNYAHTYIYSIIYIYMYIRAEKSKSLIRWKRRKGGKRREKADLVMQLAFWQTCQNAIKCHEMTKCLHFGSGSCIRIFF